MQEPVIFVLPDGVMNAHFICGYHELFGCHSAAVTNIILAKLPRPEQDKWRSIWKLDAFHDAAYHAITHYKADVVKAVTAAFAASVPPSPTQIIFSAPINYGSKSRNEAPYMKPLTADVVNQLIVDKVGIVIAGPVVRNVNHSLRSLSLCQTWVWIPPRHADQVVAGTGGTYNMETVEEGLLGRGLAARMAFARQRGDLLSPQFVEMYPHYRKMVTNPRKTRTRKPKVVAE